MISKNLNSLYPFESDFKESLKVIFFIGLAIFFLVLFFRSETYTNDGPWSQRVFISSYFGLVSFLIPIINTLIFQRIVTPEKEQKWKVKNEITLYMIHFLGISLGNFLLANLVFAKDFSFLNLGHAIFSTLVIGSIPVSFHVLNEQKKLLKKHLAEAKKLNEQQHNSQADPENDEKIIEVGSIRFTERELLYIESNKNYLNIYLAGQERKTIRSTMNQMGKLLEDHPHIVRCHRAYFINTNKINRVEGNAQGLKVFVSNEIPFIPVSRSYISVIKKAV